MRVQWVDGTTDAIDVYTDNDELAAQILPKYGTYIPKHPEISEAHRVFVSKDHDPDEVFEYLQRIFE